MEDLSRLPGNPVDVLAPTAQGSAGTRHSSREAAMTAPGSVPAMSADQPGPDIGDVAYDPQGRVHVVNDAGGHQIPDSNTARPTLFTADDGHGWRRTKPGTA